MNQPPSEKTKAEAGKPSAARLSAPTPAEPPAARDRSRVIFWGAFIGIFALGAFLRFWRLDEQSLWCDEAATLSRISGSFGYLLDSLRGLGFPPGWYAALWLWLQFLPHIPHIPRALAESPGYLRSLGAFLGTLNIAAGYFLARQFLSRRAALFVMLLVAVNPFLIYYSRDLKMYAAFFLLVTVNMALFFRWLNGRHLIWGPLYILSAVSLIAMDMLGWFLIPLQLIFLIFRRRRRIMDFPIWLISVTAMAACTIGWYRYNYGWVHRVITQHGRMGIGWLPHYNVINWHTVLGASTINLLGILWPMFPPTPRIIDWYHLGADYHRHFATRTIPFLAELELWLAILTMVILLLGLFPWRRWSGEKPEAESHPGRWWHVGLWILLPTLYFALASLPPDNPWSLYPHRVIWLQRYMGFMTMAWVLWLATAIARLPTRPVRVVTGGILTAAMLASALTNNLICRSEPWAFIDRPIMRYYNPGNHLGMYIAYSQGSNNPMDDPAISLLELEHYPLRDLPVWRLPDDLWYKIPRYQLLYDPSRQWESVIDWAAIDRGLHTLVLADRMGDIHSGPLSTPAVEQVLGRRWKLVKTVRFNWYFQWQYYFYSPIRVRVFRSVDRSKH